ncbi:MAG: transcription termination factor NusA [Dehalococcoidales bacterium]|nr:transcription termination factor NusA [Dehalococcoidales bacterium]
MKSDFILAITQLSAEKNLTKEVVLSAVESALASAYRKEKDFTSSQNISVKIDPNSGGVEVWAEKIVMERPADSDLEISLEEARKINKNIQINETVMIEVTPHNAGRIAAQTAKHVILQRLHEAEHSAIFEEYTGKEEDVITGVVQRIEAGQLFIDLGRTEALLPMAEQVRNERYRIGQRLKVFLLQVARTPRGPRVIVSRSHPDLLRRLFELEIPEAFNGTVEIKAIAREAGHRSKVAVATRQKGIDPIGCCVGLRGIRIQNIVNELNGEKIDVIMWDPDAAIFLTNALSPAQILSVSLNEPEGIATVVVPDRQLSLAIGKEGQNARLAAKLTGWRIDIKSASSAEVEKAAAAKPPVETEEREEIPTEEETMTEVEPVAEIPDILEEAEAAAEKTVAEAAATIPRTREEAIPVFFKPQVTENKPHLRFTEDTMLPGKTKAGTQTKKKKKKGTVGKESAENGVKRKKQHRGAAITIEEDEEYD